MSVSSLREVTIGVGDLQARRDQMESDLGLATLAFGTVTSTTAWRLFDLPTPHLAAVMGSAHRSESPRIRLVEATGMPPARPQGIQGPGPLGVGYGTGDIARVYARLQRSDVRFTTPPLPRPARPDGDGSEGLNASALETFGQSRDGDFMVLSQPPEADRKEGGIRDRGAEPRDASFIVTNLQASLHFMTDVLEREVGATALCSGTPFDALMGMGPEVSFRLASSRGSGPEAGAIVLMEFDRRLTPPPQFPAFGRGLCRLRYDTTDLHATLARVPGGGGSLVRGPSGIDDPVLGRGLVALVRAPFGIVIELWQTT